MSDRLLDDISRILASPMPRRTAMKMFAGVFGAAAAAVVGMAGADCKQGEKVCGDMCCKKREVCVTQGASLFCKPAGMLNKEWASGMAASGGIAGATVYTVAVNSGCKKNETQCGPICCPPGLQCKQGTCCPPGLVCGDVCCPAGSSCVNGKCEPQHPSVSR